MESVDIGLYSEEILEWIRDDEETDLLLTAASDFYEQAQSRVTPVSALPISPRNWLHTSVTLTTSACS